jgi:hypothetical protein
MILMYLNLNNYCLLTYNKNLNNLTIIQSNINKIKSNYSNNNTYNILYNKMYKLILQINNFICNYQIKINS